MPAATPDTIAQLRARMHEIEAGAPASATRPRPSVEGGAPDADAGERRSRVAPAPRRAGADTGEVQSAANAVREALAAMQGSGAGAGARGLHGDARATAPDDEEARAFKKVERLASAREQASAPLRARLVRDGFSEQAAACAVERACACGLVDDMRYADVLVRSRRAQGKGMQGIAAELDRIGIDAEAVEAYREARDEGSEDDEVTRALALLERRPPRAKAAREAAYRRLMQKGYGASVAARAARRWAEGRAAQE